MKNLITYLKALWGAWGNLQSSDVSVDCRLTVGSPSGFGSKSLLKLVSVLVLILTVGVGNAWGAALGAGYTKITNITSLSAGDKVVLYCDDASVGVTGYSGSDATVAASGWTEFTVEKSSSNYFFKTGTKYIKKQTSNKFTIDATSQSDNYCTVNSSGVLCINSRYLCKNSSYYRMYTSIGSFKPFYVYKVAAATPTVTPDPTSLSWGTVLQGSSQSTKTISITGANLTAGTLTISATGGYSVTPTSKSVSGTLAATTLTVTPPSTSTAGSKNGKVTISGGGLASSVEVNLSMTVNAASTVTWMNNGSEYTTTLVENGSKPTFPATPSSCDLTCTTFYGWSTSAWSGSITSLAGKTIYTKASDMPDVSGDVPYYAVYSDGLTTEYTFTSSSWNATSGGASANWTSGKAGAGYTAGQGVQVTTTYTGANATSPKSFSNVNKVVVTYNTNKTAGAGSIGIKIGSNSEVTNDVAYDSDISDDGRSANFTTEYTFSPVQTGTIKLTANTTTNSIWPKSIAIYSGAATPHYITTCCTPLGSINGSINMTSSTDGTVTISDWTYAAGSTGTTESNVSSYTVKLYKLTGTSPDAWTIVSGSTSGGSSGTQGTRTGIATNSKSVTYSGLEYGATYKFTVTAIGTGSYCDGPETAVTSINGNSLTDNKFLNKYSIYIDDGTNSDSGWGHHYIESLSSHTGNVTLNSLTAGATYKFKLTLGRVIWYSADATMTSSNCTDWTFYSNVSENCGMTTGLGGNYIFAINAGTPTVSVTYPSASQAADKIIYWDASIHGDAWSKLCFRVGTSSNSNARETAKNSSNLVPGTDQFYKMLTCDFGSMEAWTIANNTGWTGTNSVYRTDDEGDYTVTKSIAYQDYAVVDPITIIPTTSGSAGGSSENDGCTFYTLTKYDGMLTHNISVGSADHGTVVATYTNTSGLTGQTVAEGANADLAHRCIATITATPDAGYQLSSLTVNGAAFTSENTHILTADATIAATFTAQTYNITLDREGASTGSENVTMTYNSSSHTAITAPTKTGYNFGGWYSGDNGTGSQVMNASGVLQANVDGYTGAGGVWTRTTTPTTLYAKWTPVNYTISYDLDGGSVATPNPTSYTILSSAITLNNPTKTGYDFAGWTGTGLAEATMSVTIAAGSTGERSYTATWSIKKYTVTWHVGESTSTTSNVEHFTTFSTLEASAPAHADNALAACGSTKFIGWVKAAGAWTEDGKTVAWYNTYKYAAADQITDDVDIYAMYAEASGSSTDYTLYSGILTEGDYVLVYDGGALKNTVTSSRFDYEEPTISTNTISSPAASIIWHIAKDGDYWTIYNANVSQYAGGTTTKNQGALLGSVTNYAKWSCSSTAESTTYDFANKGRAEGSGDTGNKWLRKNTTYGFACYASGTGGALSLYKLTVSYINYRTGCTVSCSRPTPSAPASVTKTSATISWAAGSTGTPESYEYKVWEDGTDEPVSGTTTTGTSVNLTGLYSGVTYHWKVKADCGDIDGESIWATGTNFTTTAAALTYSVPDGVSAVTTPATTAGDLNSAEVPTSCGSCWAFVGWTTAAYAENSSAPATLFPAGTKAKVSGDATLHAVYGKVRYQLIGETSDLEANADYILTSLYNDHEYALTATVGSGANYAASTDVTSQVQETPEGYFLYNPNATNIWKFTGTAASGRLYNATNAKYVDLSAVPVLKDATSDNLAFTNPDPEDAAFNIASTTTSSNKLRRWDDLDWGISSTVTDVYMYQLESSAYATTPDCRTFTVTWDVNNGATTSTSNVTKCQGYLASLPDNPANNTLSSCQTNGKFVGWSPTKVMPAQDVVPTGMFSEAEYSPEITQDTTFYAVFAEEHTGSVAATNKTFTFTSGSWADDLSGWDSGSAGNWYNSAVQVTKNNTGANATTKDSYDDVTKVTVTYFTNGSAGAGTIDIQVNGTSYTGSASVTSTGGTTPRTIDFTNGTALDGNVKITVTCSTNSVYIQSVQIFYTGSTTTYDQYRTACCNDPQLKFLDGEGDPTTEYVIVREDLASASSVVEIDCDISSLNTTEDITWKQTKRIKTDYHTADTWNASQTNRCQIDITNHKISAYETGSWQITIEQLMGSTNYCDGTATVNILVKTIDKFIDAVNGNFSGEAQSLEDVGNGIILPTEATFSTNNGCADGTTRRLIGWIKASDLATYASSRRVDMIDDLKTSDPATNKVIAPGTKVQATGVTWYAVWGVEK